MRFSRVLSLIVFAAATVAMPAHALLDADHHRPQPMCEGHTPKAHIEKTAPASGLPSCILCSHAPVGIVDRYSQIAVFLPVFAGLGVPIAEPAARGSLDLLPPLRAPPAVS